MTTPADTARSYAAASSSPYVGVILLRMPPQVADQTPSWRVNEFSSRAALDDWYEDAVGSTHEYFYLAIFDKTPAPWRAPGHAIAEAPHQGPHVGATIAGVAMSKFDQLAHIVALHETYFAALAQKYPHSEQVRQWLTGDWDPFFRRWLDVTADGSPLTEPLITRVSQALSQLRDAARGRGIPVPDLGTATPSHAPAPAPAPAVDPMVAQMNAETDRRFAAQYGVQHKLNPRNPHDAAMIPLWLDLRYQVAQEAAELANRQLGTELADTLSSGGGHHHGGGGGGHHHGGGRRQFWGGGGGWGWGWDPYWYGFPYGYGYDDVDVNVYVNPPPNDLRWNDYGAVISGERGGRFERVPHHERLVAIAPALVPELMGGWFDSITGAVHAAINGVGHAASSVVGTVGHTLYKLKGPIAAAAGIAAGAAAMAIPGAGPLVAPMAAGLANNLVNAAAGDGDVAQAAQAVVTQATELAQKSPEVAKALGTAHEAVAKAATGYHIVQTVANAAAGNKDALDQINELSLEAAAGNPAAQSAIQLAHGAISASEQQQQTKVSGAAHVTPRQQAQAAARDQPNRIVGVVQRADGSWSVEPFASSDDADDWFGSWLNLPDAYAYVAYFDKADAAWPNPLNEQASKHPATHVGHWSLPMLVANAARGDAAAQAELDLKCQAPATTVGHWFLPLLVGLPIGAAVGHYGPRAYGWTKAKWDARKLQKLADQEIARLHAMDLSRHAA